MTEIILNDISVSENGQSNRTARIAQRYEIANQLYEVVAFMNNHNVRIARMSDNTRAKSFQLSADEMDTLAATWMRFRSDCIEAKEAEEKRIEEVKAQAFKLAEEQNLHIEKDGQVSYGAQWHVYQDNRWIGQARTYDDLLEVVSNYSKPVDKLTTF